jgi:hypothetical protein
MAGAGKKTFTAGEVLTASDVNTYLMEQSVMVFGGTAARASAIPTPSTGMTTYIGVTGTATIPQIETYTGSAWQTPYGATLVANVNFSSAASIAVDNVFDSKFDHYRVIIFITTKNTTQQGNMQLRAAGSTIGGVAYRYQSQRSYGGTIDAAPNSAGTSNFPMPSAIGNGQPAIWIMDFYNPAVAATSTFWTSTFFCYDGGTFLGCNQQGAEYTSAVRDGFIMNSVVGSATGTIKVYGYRNS